MVKHLIILVLLSVLVVLGMQYPQIGVKGLLAAHDWVSQLLTQVFSGGQVGNTIRELLALLCIPVVVGLIPSIIYWVVRRHWVPYFMEIVWIVWLVQFGALAIAYKMV